ncbi:MAG: hypothetical protein JO208_07370, partial [Alphaproteobacteria bacterium]|nr:hypothetical protein [Alphaproteobacteria bacterium]
MSGLAASVASPTVPTAKGIESPDAEFVLALEDMGLAAPAERLKITRCSGGISCEVWLVEPAGRSSFVAKRPLAKLGVVADWAAPVERSRTEADWLKLVAAIDRALVPEVLAEDRVHNVFAMEYLPPAQYPVWKVQLAEGHIDSGFAGDVG